MGKKDKKRDRSRSKSDSRDRKSKRDRKEDKQSKKDKKSKKHSKRNRSPSSSRSISPKKSKKTANYDDKFQSKTFHENIKKEKSQEKQQKEEETFQETDLIPSLKEGDQFLQEKYNEKMKKDEVKQSEELKALRAERPGRAGGVYIPPHKLKQMQQEILENEDESSKDHQRLQWELLRKSINGIVNKVNISNIQNVIIELINENILRGKGLLSRAIIKAQMASPNFTHVYAALISVINTKLPEIVDLLIRRVILQFQKSYQRNNKIVCQATLRMMGHLINQKVLNEELGFQILLTFVEDPTEDSIELACDFIKETGQTLTELLPPGMNAIFESLRQILHNGDVSSRVQYGIENIFAVRKTQFADFPGVIPELDLVEEDDQITHQFDIRDKMDPQEMLNIFKYDPFFKKTEEEWTQIKTEILGEENVHFLIKPPRPTEEIEEEEDEEQKIQDLTEEQRTDLRKQLYLLMMNSLIVDECVHKVIKMNIGHGNEYEVCNMIVDTCMNVKSYQKFYGQVAERFCLLEEVYRDNFMKCFVESYTYVHRFETNKIRNCAKLFSHLLYKEAIDWRIISCISLSQETTTASSRIFIKILIQEMSENMGLEQLYGKFQDEELQEYFVGLFPKDHPKNTRFAINFFTSIGVGELTADLRATLQQQTQAYQDQLQEKLQQQIEIEAQANSGSSSDSSSNSDSSSSSDSD